MSIVNLSEFGSAGGGGGGGGGRGLGAGSTVSPLPPQKGRAPT